MDDTVPLRKESQRLSKHFEVLSDSYRRGIVVLLTDLEQEEAVSFDALLGIDRATDNPETELYHKHLPKLDDWGYIEWERERGTIRRGPCFEELEDLVEVLRENVDGITEEWP